MSQTGNHSQQDFHEHKTFDRSPLHMIVYQLREDGVPISYERIYRRQWEQLLLIEQKVREFYYARSTIENNLKLSQNQLARDMKLPHSTMKIYLMKLACLKQIKTRNGKGEWKVIRNQPPIIVQQKAKHVSKDLWGKKTPVYILPYQTKYYTTSDT